MKNRGFTMVELLITMVIFVFVIAGASRIFIGLLSQFKQQGSISGTNIQGQAGLEMMRRDMTQAGYGLPTNLSVSGSDYYESASVGDTYWVDRFYSDGPTDNPQRGNCPGGSTCGGSVDCDLKTCCNIPAPFRSGDNAGIANNDSSGSKVPGSQSDILVIKSANVAMSDSSQKWTYISNAGGTTNIINIWGGSLTDPQNPATDDQVIFVQPGAGAALGLAGRTLQLNSGNFWDSLNDPTFTFSKQEGGGASGSGNLFEPGNNSFTQYIVYDIAPKDPNSSHIRMPFNRADYYIKMPPSAEMPPRCAPNTGTLYKAVTINTMNNDGYCNSTGGGGGGCVNRYPIMDCVADMQVVYLMGPANSTAINWCPNSGDASGDPDSSCKSAGYHVCPNQQFSGGAPTYGHGSTMPTASPTSNMACYTATEIRKYLKEVRVYIVAQEGRRDPNYNFTAQDPTRTSLSAEVDNPNDPADTYTYSVGLVNLKNLVGPDYIHYRWKLYTIVVDPKDMN